MGKDKYQDISDKELLQRFWQTQNNEWLGILLQRYTLLLLGVCMKYLKDETDARDCVQQIFLKVIQEAGKYKIDYFKSWLYMVAKNQCLTLLRDKKGKTSVELDDTNSHVAEDVDGLPEEGALAISDEMLQEALQELNEEQYKCVTLFYLKKKSYQEISENTGYPMLKVKSHIQNGKRNLKLSIQKKMKAADSTNAR
ncbi:RNA polymerase sigma factor [Niabella sp. CJ426]|uniref:RNA polymerase sigma factor n=1 Tax=Niabella sp. CJ426 TaxID=3393740 RepID=UPI003D0405AE